jgi:hypothetical protein
VAVIGGAPPARAGGSWLDPVFDRYEAGEVATLVGYVGPGPLGWVDDGPFFAYLRAGDVQVPPNPVFSDQGTPVGRLEVEPAGGANANADASLLRVRLSFRLPSSLPPGSYGVAYCNDPCTTGLGDLIGGRLAVGLDPPSPWVRNWPPDEPEIANLGPDALVAGPGYVATADQIRSGAVPPPASAVPAPAVPPTLVSPVAVAPPPPATAAPAQVVPAPVPTATVLVQSPAAAPATGPAGTSAARPPSQPTNGQNGTDPWFLIVGSALAAVCTVSVLRALRRGPPPRPANAAQPLGVPAVPVR